MEIKGKEKLNTQQPRRAWRETAASCEGEKLLKVLVILRYREKAIVCSQTPIRRWNGRMSGSSSVCPFHQELDYGIEVHFFFRANAIAAHLSTTNVLQIKLINQLIDREFLLEI